jgi:tetratricopeptide (TPR) repeat protein
MKRIPGMKSKSESARSAPRFDFVETVPGEKRTGKKVPKSSLERLIFNSENISELLKVKTGLKNIRFDELELLRDIRELVDTDPKKFENIKDPVEFRREIRAKILSKYITDEFIRLTQEKLLNVLLKASRTGPDQDALMTALVFLQSHTDLGLPLEDNPLWEIIFNLSIKDGLKFINVLTVLIEGLDSLKISHPEILTREPLILQKTKQICQWPIFWKLLIEQQEILPFEAIVSSILRGELMFELYFDELVHLPYYLYQLYKPVLQNDNFITETIPDGDKQVQANELYSAILKSVEKDLPSLLPTLIKRIEKILKKVKESAQKEQLQLAVDTLKTGDHLINNIFLMTLIAAKISMKKYWENQRDRFFFFTILKNPLDAKNYFDYGHILLKQKHTANAKQLFNCAIEIDPQNFWGFWGLGNFYFKINKFVKADEFYHKSLKIAQQLEIQKPNLFRRELFLIKEDIKKLKQKKLKLQASEQPQIDLFGIS